MKIYTKTGDTGTTGLFAGPRVAKDHPRISAYGAVDELNAVLGILAATAIESRGRELQEGDDQELDWHLKLDGKPLCWREMIALLQSDLFSIGAELATPEPQKHGMCLLAEERVQFLEACIDAMEATLPPLSQFVLPGGTQLSAQMHLARTVCRRAERDVVHLSHQPGTSDCSLIVVYLNRLSDFLFVLARWANLQAGVPDVPWHRPEASRGSQPHTPAAS